MNRETTTRNTHTFPSHRNCVFTARSNRIVNMSVLDSSIKSLFLFFVIRFCDRRFGSGLYGVSLRFLPTQLFLFHIWIGTITINSFYHMNRICMRVILFNVYLVRISLCIIEITEFTTKGFPFCGIFSAKSFFYQIATFIIDHDPMVCHLHVFSL